MLSKCGKGETSVERMIAVVGWSISTLRPLMFGVAPFNPILGETHHVSRASLNVLLEQVKYLFKIFILNVNILTQIASNSIA